MSTVSGKVVSSRAAHGRRRGSRQAIAEKGAPNWCSPIWTRNHSRAGRRTGRRARTDSRRRRTRPARYAVKAADAAVERSGGIDIVLANAGIASFGSMPRRSTPRRSSASSTSTWSRLNTVRATLPSVIAPRLCAGGVLIICGVHSPRRAPWLPTTRPRPGPSISPTRCARGRPLPVSRSARRTRSWIDTPLVQDAICGPCRRSGRCSPNCRHR